MGLSSIIKSFVLLSNLILVKLFINSNVSSYHFLAIYLSLSITTLLLSSQFVFHCCDNNAPPVFLIAGMVSIVNIPLEYSQYGIVNLSFVNLSAFNNCIFS